jgi:hypothetical protein
MAALVQCDICGAVVPHTKATLARCYKLASATTYREMDMKKAIDMCNACYGKLTELLKQEVVIDAD